MVSASPSSAMTEPMSPSVCRNASEKTARKVSAGDRQGRIIWLAAARGARLRPPRRDRLVREPNGQTATPPQCRVVFRPVRDPIARLGDMMTVLGVVFERHGGFPIMNGATQRQSGHDHQLPPG